jgi:hypothetical protein
MLSKVCDIINIPVVVLFCRENGWFVTFQKASLSPSFPTGQVIRAWPITASHPPGCGRMSLETGVWILGAAAPSAGQYWRWPTEIRENEANR